MDYREHLSKDKKFKRLISDHHPVKRGKQKDLLFYLIASIMSQQLSTKVAQTIQQRFLALYEGRMPTAEEVLATPFETLRSIGLSNAKARYVHNVAQFAVEKGMDHKTLNKMENEAVIAWLTQIKVVGRWTAEMLLMFGLGRVDLFSICAFGHHNSVIHLYNFV